MQSTSTSALRDRSSIHNNSTMAGSQIQNDSSSLDFFSPSEIEHFHNDSLENSGGALPISGGGANSWDMSSKTLDEMI